MRLPTPNLPTAAVLVACGILLAAAGLTALSRGVSPHVDVTVAVPADGRLSSGDIGSLLVTLSTSSAVLEPRFFVVLGPVVYLWHADGPQVFHGPGTIAVRISAPCADCAIPSGAMFLVRVYDVPSRSYAFSTIMRA